MIRAVFDASAKSSSGVSLNDLLLVGPTVHSSLVDVLLHFLFHRVALTVDVSKMYRAIELTPENRDLHRFVWRQSTEQLLQDFRMTRLTFGVSVSSFAANMSVKQNALDFALEYPQAVKAVEDSFYVDDGLTGADSIEEAIQLQQQLHELFSRGGFLLRKWNSSEAVVLQRIAPELTDSQSLHQLQTRMNEHKAAIKYAKTNESAVADHVWTSQHQIDLQSVSILAREPNLHQRLTLESWYIKSCDNFNSELGSLAAVYNYLL